ncbi:hypothetical protein [Actinorhabdospora filicis]|uniref:hypothetical protein n=1 Tax=Actinorhabdospora filicis TaxID=1785913 RepID=UPI0025575FC5|nr:hypothetical protein [Actinorhabdospora filicis]
MIRRVGEVAVGYLFAFVPIVLFAVAAGLNLAWWAGAWFGAVAAGLVLLAAADALVCVRLGPDALVAENRWTRVRVPWGEAGKVVTEVPGLVHRKGARVRARLMTSAGPLALDVAAVGARSRTAASEVADRLDDEVEARRTAARGRIVRERPWGRIALRVAGLALAVGPLVAVFALGFVFRAR